MANVPLKVPIYPPGKEPLPPGFTEGDRAILNEQMKYQRWMTLAMESCVAKTILAGGAGELVYLKCRLSVWNVILESLGQGLDSVHSFP
jgi:hypothetical protein